ncbi:MAG: DNA polymerase Y family protein [Candidatus Krumholzibacteria bacterium]
MACVNLPAFPLQLLIRRHPDWKTLPAAVVDKDTPQGVILWVNSRATRYRILPGMRYAKGLSLSPDLRAGVIAAPEIEKHITALTERLRFFTPDVEPSQHAPGIFWLGASGLSLLYPSMKKWAGLIGSELARDGYHWTVAVGFTRYGTYAAAQACKKILVFDSAAQERKHARTVPLVRLGFDPVLRSALDQLGITSLGEFIDLPATGIRKRFGPEAHTLYKLAKNELYAPIDPLAPREPFAAGTTLDHPVDDVARLLIVVETLLESIVASLVEENMAVAAISLSLTLDNGEKRTERLRPAASTIDATQILKLIELRLQSISLSSGVVDITVEAEEVTAVPRQLQLFSQEPTRDLRAADRAFARLRAEFGEHAVMKATLRDGHLPEARYRWEPMEKLPLPSPRKVKARSLVRKIFSKSIALLSWSHRTGDGRPTNPPQYHGRQHHTGRPFFGIEARPPEDMSRPTGPRAGPGVIGPYIISGGWWMRRIHREYYYIRSTQGRWLWIYYDRRRRRTFVQGEVA